MPVFRKNFFNYDPPVSREEDASLVASRIRKGFAASAAVDQTTAPLGTLPGRSLPSL
jgi:hypothetical protein